MKIRVAATAIALAITLSGCANKPQNIAGLPAFANGTVAEAKLMTIDELKNKGEMLGVAVGQEVGYYARPAPGMLKQTVASSTIGGMIGGALGRSADEKRVDKRVLTLKVRIDGGEVVDAVQWAA